MLLLAAALLLVTASASPQGASLAQGPSGAWEGQLIIGGNWRFMEARFDEPDVRVDLPQERREFRDFTRQANRLQWTLVRGTERIAFDGTWTGAVIRGVARLNDLSGEFQLVRVDRADGAREADLAGTYRANGGDLITVARYDFGDNVDRLALMSTREGYWGTLFPEGADQ